MAVTYEYGDHADQVADLHLPAGEAPEAGWPTAVLIHGGFWRERYTRELTGPLAEDLAGHGIASWNIEFRRVRGAGGWPATFEDVGAAIDRLSAPELPVDTDRVAVIGHSAGGHLALWATGRASLPEGSPGCAPRVTPSRVVGLAPVADLQACYEAGLSDGAVVELLGGAPDELRPRWELADPMRSVDHGVPTLLVHGLADTDVPPDFSRRYAAAVRLAGGDAELLTPACGHMELIDPSHPSWPPVRGWLAPPG